MPKVKITEFTRTHSHTIDFIFCLQNDYIPHGVTVSIPAHFFRICKEYYLSNMLTHTGIWFWNTVSQKPLDTLHKHWAGRIRRWDTLVHHVSSNSVHCTNMTQKDALHTKTFQSSYSVRTATLLHWFKLHSCRKMFPSNRKFGLSTETSPHLF